MKSVVREELKKINRAAGEYAEIFVSNWKLFLFFLVLWSGIFTGVKLSINSEFLTDGVIDTIKNAIAARTEFGLPRVFVMIFIANSFVLATAFFSGLCAVGMPLSVAVPCLGGIFFGFVGGFFYGEYGLQGAGYAMLTVFPGAVIIGIILIFACRDSIEMSGELLRRLGGARSGDDTQLKSYLLRYGIYLLLTAIASLAVTLLGKAFSGVFSL